MFLQSKLLHKVTSKILTSTGQHQRKQFTVANAVNKVEALGDFQPIAQLTLQKHGLKNFGCGLKNMV